MRLEKKVAIITGAASGIGKAVAAAFAQEGATVFIVDLQEEVGKGTEKEVRDSGGTATFLKADVSLSEDVRRVVDKVIDDCGRVDVLVNNAGMAYKATIDTLSEEQWDRQIAVNLKSVYLFCHLVVPIMARQGGGSIINMGSVTSLVGVPDFTAYVASKTGMLGITRAMALDHAHQGIRVNILCPSGVKTPLMDWQFSIAPDPQAEIKRVVDLHPIGRMADPEELAEFAVYLASDKAAYLTGAAFSIDGGYTARYYYCSSLEENVQTIPVLIVGLGQWGRHWLEDILADPGYHLAGVVDRNSENTKRMCEQLNISKKIVFSSLEAAIENTTPGTAIITVPPEHHFAVAVALINAGFNILSEKPLANSLVEALSLRKIVKNKKTIFMVSQDYRWQPPIQTLKKLINDQTIGEVGYATYRHFQALRIGGWREQMENVILEDMAIHHFDILRSISGLNCVETYAESFNPSWSWYRGGAATSVQLKFENSFHVSYFGTWVTTGNEDSWPGEIRIEGSKGALCLNAKGEVYLLRGNKAEEVPLVTMNATGRKYALIEMQKAVLDRTEPETSIEDNLQSYAITQAALLSAQARRPVTLEEVLQAGA